MLWRWVSTKMADYCILGAMMALFGFGIYGPFLLDIFWFFPLKLVDLEQLR
jgi:hypothetical protein